ncbi:MAG: hypothetical protein M1816_001584 [Peltula sp. TS41687]|nr:MAG: hypothetical protein M1816_001584 [Peltula sp. TS41687]
MATQSEVSPLLADPCRGRNDNGDSIKTQQETSKSASASSSKLIVTLAFPFVGLFLSAVELTITSTASATIAAEFGSLSVISWLGNAYLVASTIVLPLSGKLTDIFGRRSGLILSFVLFIAGNLICGVAQSVQALICGRMLAGAGGGGIYAITSYVMNDMIPQRRRGLWNGIGTAVYSVGIGIGGVFGGIVTDLFGWRWPFLALTPVATFAGVGVYFTMVVKQTLPGSAWDKVRRIDLLGALTLVMTLVIIVVGLDPQGDISSIPLAATLPVATVTFLIFVLNEGFWAAEPIVPINLLQIRSVTAACLSCLLTSSAMHTLLFYVPLFFQVRGFSISEVGLQLLGEPAGAALGTYATGLALRAIGEYGIVKPIVLLVFLGAPAGYSLSNLDTSVCATEIYLVLMGAGFGSLLTVMLIALLGFVPREAQASATGMLYAFRNIGSTVGLAASSRLLRTSLAGSRSLTPSAESRSRLQAEIPDSMSRTCHRASYAESGHWPAICKAYDHALHTVFMLALVFAAAGLVCGMFVKNKSLDAGEELGTQAAPIENEEQ